MTWRDVIELVAVAVLLYLGFSFTRALWTIIKGFRQFLQAAQTLRIASEEATKRIKEVARNFELKIEAATKSLDRHADVNAWKLVADSFEWRFRGAITHPEFCEFLQETLDVHDPRVRAWIEKALRKGEEVTNTDDSI